MAKAFILMMNGEIQRVELDKENVLNYAFMLSQKHPQDKIEIQAWENNQMIESQQITADLPFTYVVVESFYDGFNDDESVENVYVGEDKEMAEKNAYNSAKQCRNVYIEYWYKGKKYHSITYLLKDED